MNCEQFILSAWMEKNRKIIFRLLIGCIWCAIFLYSFLTVRLSDDFSYGVTARGIQSVGDIFRQEYVHYIEHSGRSIVHLFVRTFLRFDLIFFDIVNSFVFTGIILLMYANIEKRRKYDIWVVLGLFFLMWFKAVSFNETILWQVGATNYLWGSFIILGYVTFYRHLLKKESIAVTGEEKIGSKTLIDILKALGVILFGIVAGWCNENTSGGGFLLCAFFLCIYLFEDRARKIKPWMMAGLIGQLIGIFLMVMSPGERLRASFAEEEHQGVMKIMARFQKLTISMREEFFLLVAIWILCYVLCRVQKKTISELKISLIYFLVFLATAYALVAAAPAQPRALFGAGVFLFIALMNLLTQIQYDKNEILLTLRYGIPVVLLLYFAVSYIDNGANLYRIRRDELEREAYIEEEKAAGNNFIIVAQMRPDFVTEYSSAYEMDLTEDSEYWINIAYEQYYGVESISAVPREEWEELVGYSEW